MRGRLGPIVDLIPRVPVRHWVITLPDPWRTGLLTDAAARGRLRTTMMREILQALEAEARRELGDQASVYGGGVCAVHRCGTSLEPNVHLHGLVLDGVFVAQDGEPAFVPAWDEPRPELLDGLARRLRARLADAVRSPRPVRTDGHPRRIAVRQRQAPGPPVRTVVASTGPAMAWTAEHAGLRVRAGTAIDGSDRAAVIRLAGYLARAELDRSALSRPTPDTIRYRLHRPFADGTTHVEFSTAEFAARLRAFAPDARTAPITYHGVLAPRAALRPLLTPRQLDLLPAARSPRGKRAPARPRAPVCPTCDEPMQLIAARRHAPLPRTA
jgi:hypothetical protein